MTKTLLLAGTASLALCGSAPAKDLRAIGVTVGSLGNPFFVALAKGAQTRAKAINPDVRVITTSAEYDLFKQFTQVDNFIALGVDLILINAVDPRAILAAVRRARAAGIVVVGVDVAANGADATVQTDNTQAGTISCDYLAQKIGGKGNVIIENGPQVSAVIDRVKGCKAALAKHPDIKLLSDDQDGKGSREGGLAAMQGYLTRFPEIAGVFTINDPQAIGSDLAARQLDRRNLVITSVDGAPDIENALASKTQIYASASQNPYALAAKAVELGLEIMNGGKPAEPVVQIPSQLVTRDTIGTYKGWNAPR